MRKRESTGLVQALAAALPSTHTFLKEEWIGTCGSANPCAYVSPWQALEKFHSHTSLQLFGIPIGTLLCGFPRYPIIGALCSLGPGTVRSFHQGRQGFYPSRHHTKSRYCKSGRVGIWG